MAAIFRIRASRLRQLWSAGRRPILAAGLLLAASSCQTPQTAPLSNGYTPPAPRVTSRVEESQLPTSTAPASDPHIQHAVVDDARVATMIERMAYEPTPESSDTGVIQISGEVPAPSAAAISVTPIVHAAETRVPVDCPPGTPGDCPPGTPGYCPPGYCPPWATGPCPPERSYPDEYICDGGDRDLPVHFNGPFRQGLDTEDTIGEFVDENGDLQVRPSTRACVYAPRFAAVRSTSQPVLDFSIDMPAGAHDGVVLAGLDRELAPETQAQTDQLSGIGMRSRASGLGVDAGESSMGQVESTEQHLKIQNVYEDRNFFSESQFQQGLEPVLANGIQLAGIWTRDLNPVIVAADEFGQQVSSTFKVEEYVGAEDQRTPGELEILKTADTASAHPGDEITFTIRFTNRGGRPLSEVRIMDHLTPRIEYIPGSALSELDGRLDLTAEPDGTQVLTFELAEPLEGGQSGEITFRVLVR